MKILFVSFFHSQNLVGGVEKYNRFLCELFVKEGHEVDFISPDLAPNKRNKELKIKGVNDLYENKNNEPIPILKQRSLINKMAKKVEEIHINYDIIIDSTRDIQWKKSIYKNDRWVFVQHGPVESYIGIQTLPRWTATIFSFFKTLFGFKNPFKKFINVVNYTISDKEQTKTKNNSFIIPLSSFDKNEIESFKKQINTREDFYYLGTNANYKRVKKMTLLFEKNKTNLNIYGFEDIDKKYVKHFGRIESNNLNKLMKYKFSVLLSKSEGFSYTIVESISMGIPPIATNSSHSMKELLNNKGFLVRKNLRNFKKQLYEAININDDNYKKMQESCLQYALENFTNEQFSKRWLSLIKEVNSK